MTSSLVQTLVEPERSLAFLEKGATPFANDVTPQFEQKFRSHQVFKPNQSQYPRVLIIPLDFYVLATLILVKFQK
ncbi:MAG: hypothetical protein COV37_05945 [Bdellovibrio sp. CG11_big_fil_rev_8_21_14_0_20_39_38]|nr:MAG: hypothetical protein COV37_05945 [Bdellovibrio sp. CG11_big_fil_rev_8_21_14_0_20_39_38]